MELMLRLTLTVYGLVLLSTMGECDIFVYKQDPQRMIMDEFRDLPASFGPSLNAEGMRAFVVSGSPTDGCFGLVPPPPPDVPNFTRNWVVLLSRGNCSFEDKIRNAQIAGFDGVIIHNVHSDELESMSAKNSLGITIPSVFIGETDGLLLLYNYTYGNSYFIVINGDIPFNINTHLLVPFAIVVMLCLFIMIIFLVVRCVRERRRSRRHRLPSSSLKKIPICKFAKGDPYDMCAICLDDYVEGDKLRVLPCAHAYHCKCIDPWLTKNRRVCPVCKRKVFAAGERRERRSTRDSEARSAHESQSDSDTDNDRAPLINSRSNERPTQGGTFQQQRENPFVRANRTITGDRAATSEAPESRLPQSESCPDSSGALRSGPFMTGVLDLRGEQFSRYNRNDCETGDDDRQSLLAGGPSIASRSPSVRAFTEKERSKDRGSRRTSNESNPKSSRRSSQHSSHRRRRRGSDSTQVSSNSDRSHPEIDNSSSSNNVVQPNTENQNVDVQEEQGRIGVVALPNAQIQGDRQQSRRNDFII